MRTKIALLFTISTLSCCIAQEEILSEKFIKSINLKQSSWVAGRNFPEDTPIENLKFMTGGHLDQRSPRVPEKLHEVRAVNIPATFDGRISWPGCESLKNIRDQGACGSCWAFATTATMTDRLCIATNGTVKFTFSPENVLTCCKNCGNCQAGGYADRAWRYWVTDGIVSGGDYNSNEGCQPYQQSPYQNGRTPKCSRGCLNKNYPVSYKQDKHYGAKYYRVANSVAQIQIEIMKNGPVEAYIDVYQDLFSYRSGVYVHTSGSKAGGHFVKILGWGTENGTPYWLVANSWGTKWGALSGFFKIVRGKNHCRVEEQVFVGTPKI